MASFPTLIADTRNEVKDAVTDNFVTNENPAGNVDGVNAHFNLFYFPVVDPVANPGSPIVVRVNNVVQTITTQYVVNLQAGYLDFTVGNVPAAGVPITSDYYFNWFDDAHYTDFLNKAVLHLGLGTDPTVIDDGLRPALYKIAASIYYRSRATQYANRYNSSAGGQNVNVDVVTKNFIALGKQAWEEGQMLMMNFYKRFGKREAPASMLGNYSFPSYTPRR